MSEKKEKNIILYVGKINKKAFPAKEALEKHLGKSFRIGLITDTKQKLDKETEQNLDLIIRTNTKSTSKLEDALIPHKAEIAAVIAVWENAMPLYTRIIPLLPYVKNPTPRSILISNDKFEMRKALKKHAPTTIPRFMIVGDSSKETIASIEKQVGFPCVIKPASLSKSQLIQTCYYQEELETTLKDTLKKIKKLYKENKVEQEPRIVVEQLIEGKLFSTDVYINSKGKLYLTPYIYIKTGKDIGHDDFFMYLQMTPTKLSKESLELARTAIEDSIHAIGLRSCTAHVEMYKTDKNFKIVEIGARLGGFRQEILGNAYGIDHYLNDMLIHLGKAPVLKHTKKNSAAFMKFWPQKNGVLKSVKGFKRIAEEPFIVKARKAKKKGDKVGLSKFGHSYIASFHLTGKTRSEMLGNIRKIENTLKIELE